MVELFALMAEPEFINILDIDIRDKFLRIVWLTDLARYILTDLRVNGLIRMCIMFREGMFPDLIKLEKIFGRN